MSWWRWAGHTARPERGLSKLLGWGDAWWRHNPGSPAMGRFDSASVGAGTRATRVPACRKHRLPPGRHMMPGARVPPDDAVSAGHADSTNIMKQHYQRTRTPRRSATLVYSQTRDHENSRGRGKTAWNLWGLRSTGRPLRTGKGHV